MLHLVSYKILNHYDNFSKDTLMNKFANIVTNDWNVDEMHANY